MNNYFLKISLLAISFCLLSILPQQSFSEVTADQIKTTDMGTIDVGLTPIPLPVMPNQETKLQIDFIEIESQELQVHVDYKVKISKNGEDFFNVPLTHTSIGSVKIPYEFPEEGQYEVAVDVEGIWFVPMPVETALFSLDVGESSDQQADQDENLSKVQIPDWVRQNAGWWAEGAIGDSDFASGIEYMIKEGIIQIPPTEKQEGGEAIIPDWVRNNAEWWAKGLISDEDFAGGLQFLIANGIISV